MKCRYCEGEHERATDVKACWLYQQRPTDAANRQPEPPVRTSVPKGCDEVAEPRRAPVSVALPDLDEIVDAAFADALVGASTELGSRQADVLLRRLGVETESIPTLAELGAEYGVSRERIRQVEAGAVERLLRVKTAATHALVAMAREVQTPDQSLILAALSWLPDVPLGKSIKAICLLAGQSPKEASESSRRLMKQTGLPSLPTASILDYLQPKSKKRRIVVEAAWWPPEPKFDVWPTLGAARSVRGELAGSFYSEKLRRTVQYESQLERRILLQLEADNRVVRYQEQPLTIEVPLANDSVPYTPDVLVQTEDGRTVVVEVKPAFHLSRSSVLFKAAALIDWAARHGIGVFIGDSTSRSLTRYARLTLRPEVAEGLEELTERGEVRWGAFARLRESHQVRTTEFIAAVAQRAYIHQQAPFLLRRASSKERDLLYPLQVLANSEPEQTTHPG